MTTSADDTGTRTPGRPRRWGSKRRALVVAAIALAAIGAGVPTASPSSAAGTIVRLTSGTSDARLNAISGNGRYIVYETNYVMSGGPYPGPVSADLYQYDRSISTATLVRSGVLPGSHVSMSDDGRYVVYDGAPGTTHISVFDRVSATTEVVGLNTISRDPQISGDGSTIAFWTTNWTPETGEFSGIALWRRSTDTSTAVTTLLQNAYYPMQYLALSANGNVVVFHSEMQWTAGDPTGTKDVHLITGGTISRLTSNQWGGDQSTDPAISADGRYVAWEDHPPWLDPGAPQPSTSIVVRDLQLATQGSQVSGLGADLIAISADGTKLAVGDTGSQDVAIKTIGGSSAPGPDVTSLNEPFGLKPNGDFSVWSFQAADSPSIPGDTNAKTDVFVWTGTASRFDFDGDGSADRGVFRNGGWIVQGQPTVYLGIGSDRPIPADYDGDGTTDKAVYRNGAWIIDAQSTTYFGNATDKPVPADYDGDGSADKMVYRNGAWLSPTLSAVFFGSATDVPVPADYDGDGSADRMVYRGVAGAWLSPSFSPVYFGNATDKPVPADYDGDGAADKMVYRNGGWLSPSLSPVYLGNATDRPLPTPIGQ